MHLWFIFPFPPEYVCAITASMPTSIVRPTTIVFALVTCTQTVFAQALDGPTPAEPSVIESAVAYYPFDADASDAVNDHDGELLGATHWRDGTGGGNFEFDGVDDAIKILHSPQLDLQTFTIAAWIKPQWSHDSSEPDRRRRQVIVSKGGFSLGLEDTTRTGSDGRGSLSVISNGDERISTILTQNRWHHVVAHYNGTTLSLFVNGNPHSRGIPRDQPIIGEDDLWIGDSSVSNDFATPYRGRIDGVAVFARPLDDEEIRQLKDETSPPQDSVLGVPNLVAYYPLDGDTSDHGGTHNGEAISALPRSFGRIDGSYEFNGEGAHIKVPHSPQLNLETFTIAAWIRPISGKSKYYRHTIIGKGQGQTNYTPGDCFGFMGFSPTHCPIMWFREYTREDVGVTPITLAVRGNHLDVYYGPGSGTLQASVDSAIQHNQWSHIAVSYDGSIVKIYVNGELKKSQPAPAPPQNESDLTIGELANQHAFLGLINDVAIVGHALSPSAIHTLFQNAPTQPISNQFVTLDGTPGSRKLIGIERDTLLPHQVFFDESTQGPILHAEFPKIRDIVLATVFFRSGSELRRLQIAWYRGGFASTIESLDNETEASAGTISTGQFRPQSNQRVDQTLFGAAEDGGDIHKQYFYHVPRTTQKTPRSNPPKKPTHVFEEVRSSKRVGDDKITTLLQVNKFDYLAQASWGIGKPIWHGTENAFSLITPLAEESQNEQRRKLIRIDANGSPQPSDIFFDEETHGKLVHLVWGESLLAPIQITYADGEMLRDAEIQIIDTYRVRPTVIETRFFSGSGDNRGTAITTRYVVKGNGTSTQSTQIESVYDEALDVTFTYQYIRHRKTITVTASKPGNGDWVDFETYSLDPSALWGLGEKHPDADQDGIVDADDIVVSEPLRHNLLEGDEVGAVLATDGDTLLLSATGNSPGMVHVMRKNHSTAEWDHEATLFPDSRRSGFGSAFAVSGDRIIVGTPGDDEIAGIATIFIRDRENNRWAKETTLIPQSGHHDQLFGRRVSISGKFAAVSALDGTIGTVHIYELTDSRKWVPAANSPLRGMRGRANFGASIALDGKTLIVGETSSLSSNFPGSIGHIFLYQHVAANESFLGTPPGSWEKLNTWEGQDKHFGHLVGISGNRAFALDGAGDVAYLIKDLSKSGQDAWEIHYIRALGATHAAIRSRRLAVHSAESKLLHLFAERWPLCSFESAAVAIGLSRSQLIVADSDVKAYEIRQHDKDECDLTGTPVTPHADDSTGAAVATAKFDKTDDGKPAQFIAVVGRPTAAADSRDAGLVTVLVRTADEPWTKQTTLTVPQSKGFGQSVDTDGNRIIVGSDDGRIHIFVRQSLPNGDMYWKREREFKSFPNNRVAIYDHLAVVTTPQRKDERQGGTMHRFEHRAGKWQRAKIKPVVTISTNYPIDAEAAMPVAIALKTPPKYSSARAVIQTAVGVPADPSAAPDRHGRKPKGRVYIYREQQRVIYGTNGEQRITRLINIHYNPHPEDNAVFGTSVDLVNGTLIAGARGGSAYVLPAANPTPFHAPDGKTGFGEDVSLDSSGRVYVADSNGTVTVFRNMRNILTNRNAWTIVDRISVTDTPPGAPISVSAIGDQLVIGAPHGTNSNMTDLGFIQTHQIQAGTNE